PCARVFERRKVSCRLTCHEHISTYVYREALRVRIVIEVAGVVIVGPKRNTANLCASPNVTQNSKHGCLCAPKQYAPLHCQILWLMITNPLFAEPRNSYMNSICGNWGFHLPARAEAADRWDSSMRVRVLAQRSFAICAAPQRRTLLEGSWLYPV